MPKPSQVVNQPLDLEHAIKWTPADDSYYLLASTLRTAIRDPLIVHRRALQQVERHMREARQDAVLGLLVGRHCVDEREKLPYLLLTDAERLERAPSAELSRAALAPELGSLIRRVERSGRTVLGWYLATPLFAPLERMRDVALHRALFPRLTTVGYARIGCGSEQTGAFWRVESTEERVYNIPFHELSRSTPSKDGTLYTVVDWTNYRPDSAVVAVTDDVEVATGEAPALGPAKRAGVAGLIGRAREIARRTPTAGKTVPRLPPGPADQPPAPAAASLSPTTAVPALPAARALADEELPAFDVALRGAADASTRVERSPAVPPAQWNGPRPRDGRDVERDLRYSREPADAPSAPSDDLVIQPRTSGEREVQEQDWEIEPTEPAESPAVSADRELPLGELLDLLNTASRVMPPGAASPSADSVASPASSAPATPTRGTEPRAPRGGQPPLPRAADILNDRWPAPNGSGPAELHAPPPAPASRPQKVWPYQTLRPGAREPVPRPEVMSAPPPAAANPLAAGGLAPTALTPAAPPPPAPAPAAPRTQRAAAADVEAQAAPAIPETEVTSLDGSPVLLPEERVAPRSAPTRPAPTPNRSVMVAAAALLVFVGAAAGAALWPRARHGGASRGVTATARSAVAATIDSVSRIDIASGLAGAASSPTPTGDVGPHSYTRAFLLAEVATARDSLRRSLRAIDAALADARTSSRRAEACHRANAAYVGVLLQRTGIVFARAKLRDSLATELRDDLDSLVRRADAMPAAIGDAGCSP